MADDRERNQGIKQRGGEGSGEGGRQAPGRNPQDDRSAGYKPGDQQKQPANEGGQQPDGGQKEGGQNEDTRR